MTNCLMNASGCSSTTHEELDRILNSRYCSSVVTKSCTLQRREGNIKPRFAYDNELQSSINSMGLPNWGFDYYLLYVIENSDQEKPIIISLSAIDTNRTLVMLKRFKRVKQKIYVEINVSCPNIINKPQLAYSMKSLDNFLKEVQCCYNELDNVELGLKLPPYFDPHHWNKCSKVLLSYTPMIKWITCCNSIGNGLLVKDNETLIKPKYGFGGLGGKIMKPTALANVRAFYVRLGNHIDIYGCGGVTNGRDVYDLILCGATKVQIGTRLYIEGVNCLKRIQKEFNKILKEKNITDYKKLIGTINH